MAGKIFINYRRGDDPGFTQALYLRLEQEFPASDLFMDVEGKIKPGDDFEAVLISQVAACDIMLVVVGPRWADLMAARIGDPKDFVVIEIKAALDRGKRVIPVLVGGAVMPRVESLPEPISGLLRLNAVSLRPERFKVDCEGLVTALRHQLAASDQERMHRAAPERQSRIEAPKDRAPTLPVEVLPQQRATIPNMVHWWPIWVASLVCIFLTAGFGERIVIGDKTHLVSTSPWVGIGFLAVMFVTLNFTHMIMRVRSIYVLVMAVALIGFIVHIWIGWVVVFDQLMLIKVHMNLAYYVVTFLVTFGIWLYAIFIRPPLTETIDMSGEVDLGYYWIIWFAALVCIVLTVTQGDSIQVGDKALRIHTSPWVGIGFVGIMLSTLILPIRGPLPYVLITFLLAATLGATILSPALYMNIGYYVVVFVVSSSLLGVWAYHKLSGIWR